MQPCVLAADDSDYIQHQYQPILADIVLVPASFPSTSCSSAEPRTATLQATLCVSIGQQAALIPVIRVLGAVSQVQITQHYMLVRNNTEICQQKKMLMVIKLIGFLVVYTKCLNMVLYKKVNWLIKFFAIFLPVV